MTHNVPVQSLIDHIKTAIDVDPWAKEMVEELLKEQEHKDKMFHALEEDWKRLKAMMKEQEAIVRCKDCKHYRYYGLSEETVSECTIDHAENPDGNWFCADGVPKEGR